MKLAAGLALSLLILAAPASAEPVPPALSGADASPAGIAWLQKVASAARRLNYAGTFVYQHGNQFETSRIIHFVDESGDYAKLETLDGPPREVIRNNDEVLCYYPESKTVKVEKRRSKSFPALLPDQLAALAEYYTIRIGEQERVAGYDAQTLILDPKDSMRYGHKFWAEINTGLLLKARMMNEQKQVVEQIAFTHLTIAGEIDKDMVKPKWNAHVPEWKLDSSGVAGPESGDTGWLINKSPVGFKKIMETQRILPGRHAAVSHIVYSDGLAAISVFIEPVPVGFRPAQGLSHQGAINIYSRSVADHMVTVLGEAPTATVLQIGDSVTLKK